MSFSTMSRFTHAQLTNPVTFHGFISARTDALVDMLTSPQSSTPTDIELMCIAGTNSHVRSAYRAACTQTSGTLGIDRCIESLTYTLVTHEPARSEVLWQLMEYLHRVGGHQQEADSLRWLLAHSM